MNSSPEPRPRRSTLPLTGSILSLKNSTPHFFSGNLKSSDEMNTKAQLVLLVSKCVRTAPARRPTMEKIIRKLNSLLSKAIVEEKHAELQYMPNEINNKSSYAYEDEDTKKRTNYVGIPAEDRRNTEKELPEADFMALLNQAEKGNGTRKTTNQTTISTTTTTVTVMVTPSSSSSAPSSSRFNNLLSPLRGVGEFLFGSSSETIDSHSSVEIDKEDIRDDEPKQSPPVDVIGRRYSRWKNSTQEKANVSSSEDEVGDDEEDEDNDGLPFPDL